MREGTVDEHFAEDDAFILESLHDQVVGRPEILFGKSICTQAVLVGDHHEFIIEFPGNAGQVLENFWIKLHLFEGVHLLVGRFEHQGTVAINE